MTSKELATVGKTFAGFGGYINYEDYIFLLTVLTSKYLTELFHNHYVTVYLSLRNDFLAIT